MRRRIQDNNPTIINKYKRLDIITFHGYAGMNENKITLKGQIIGFTNPDQNALYIFKPDNKEYTTFYIGEDEII